jgi:hypothetical protein
MAGDEDEAEEVVADGVVESGVEVGRGLFEGFEFAGELFVFALGDGVTAEEIDGAAFGGGGEPCSGMARRIAATVRVLLLVPLVRGLRRGRRRG